ncbi:TPA: hypothetical protein QDB01_000336 [Burkholderia vietnamiensis]|nr:hypothetical protein [Burkholderia vietnamiensis]
MTTMQTFDEQPLDPVMRAERDIEARLSELHEGAGLQRPITPGPVFVLLARAVGEPDFDVTPEVGACEAAAKKLCAARPGGYYIDERVRQSTPRTFGSLYPNPTITEDRFAYVHVSGEGMLELVSGEIADTSTGLVVGLVLIKKWIKDRDAKAMRAAFEALETDGPIVVAVALLRTQGVEVRSRGTVPAGGGVLQVPYVTIKPRCFADRSQVNAKGLNPMVDDLWTAIVQQASSTRA